MGVSFVDIEGDVFLSGGVVFVMVVIGSFVTLFHSARTDERLSDIFIV